MDETAHTSICSQIHGVSVETNSHRVGMPIEQISPGNLCGQEAQVPMKIGFWSLSLTEDKLSRFRKGCILNRCTLLGALE
jgi:hypothetical protein